MKSDLTIASSNIHDLIGYGIEFLLDREGNIIATFTNGAMNVSPVVVTEAMAQEVTKIVA